MYAIKLPYGIVIESNAYWWISHNQQKEVLYLFTPDILFEHVVSSDSSLFRWNYR